MTSLNDRKPRQKSNIRLVNVGMEVVLQRNEKATGVILANLVAPENSS